VKGVCERYHSKAASSFFLSAHNKALLSLKPFPRFPPKTDQDYSAISLFNTLKLNQRGPLQNSFSALIHTHPPPPPPPPPPPSIES